MAAHECHSPDACKAALLADVLGRFGRVRMRVTGSSMIPSIWPGDVVTVERCEPGRAQIGDIAVFLRDDRVFAHRLVGHVERHLVTQGDAMPTPDPPVSAREFAGIVVGIGRDGCQLVPGELRPAGRLLAGIVKRSTFATRLILRGRTVVQALNPPAADSRGAGLTGLS